MILELYVYYAETLSKSNHLSFGMVNLPLFWAVTFKILHLSYICLLESNKVRIYTKVLCFVKIGNHRIIYTGGVAL